MVIDVITYNGEKELFDLRYNILKDYVAEFIVVEFDKTFSGKDKESSFLEDLQLGITQIPDGYTSMTILKQTTLIRYFFIKEEQYNKYKELALSSPNTNYGKGAEHWVREFCQKESIKDCLTHLQDNDIVFIGDCDEIWDPIHAKSYGGTLKIGLRVYTYYLNNRSSEEFYGTLRCKYESIKDSCLNHLRSATKELGIKNDLGGWHFTSLKDNLRQKLEDSYTAESYATPEVIAQLEENIKNNKDFLGRNFTYKVDESDWPQYLKDNKGKYEHLCKNMT